MEQEEEVEEHMYSASSLKVENLEEAHQIQQRFGMGNEETREEEMDPLLIEGDPNDGDEECNFLITAEINQDQQSSLTFPQSQILFPIMSNTKDKKVLAPKFNDKQLSHPFAPLSSFFCDYCEKKFKSKITKQKHIRKNCWVAKQEARNGIPVLESGKKDMPATSSVKLSSWKHRHRMYPKKKRVVHLDPMQCPACDMILGSQQMLVKHLELNCRDGPTNAFASISRMKAKNGEPGCPFCMKPGYAVASKLRFHVTHFHVESLFASYKPHGMPENEWKVFCDNLFKNMYLDAPRIPNRKCTPSVQCNFCSSKFGLMTAHKFHMVTQHEELLIEKFIKSLTDNGYDKKTKAFTGLVWGEGSDDEEMRGNLNGEM